MENSKREVVKDELSCGCGHCGNARHKHKEQKGNGIFTRYPIEIARIILSIVIFVVGFFTPSAISIASFIVSAIIVGYDLIINFIKNAVKLNFFDENTLMLIACITAFILGEHFEGALIVILFFTGELLERIATDNSRRKIAGLSKLKSSVAHLITKSGMQDVSPNQVTVNSLIEVKSGETVPIDGVLIGISCDFDMKAITGESKYVTVNNGQVVYSGAINVGNPVVIRTTREYKDSTVEKIISTVEGSLAKKAKSQRFITNFAKIYTPVVFGVALLIAVAPPFIDQMNFIKWIYKALSFLVISCPCALVISVPLSFFVGIGGLAKTGVLVKGSSYLEKLAKVNCVVFDKTGTITKGDFAIEKIETFNSFSEKQIIDFASILESKSTHPIAKAICKYNSSKINLAVTDVKELQGKGICGKIDGKLVCIGNDKLMEENGLTVNDSFAGTVLYLLVDYRLAGKIFIVDTVKENAKNCIQELKNVGVNDSYILSGDSELIVKSVGQKIGVSNVYYQLLPQEKVDKLKEIKNNCTGNVLYVGDGINDCPALALSDVGIAMGGLGSEIATSSADIVIMDDNLDKIPKSICHARKVRRAVLQNIIGSLLVKFSIMVLSLVISLPVWVAMLSDVGVMVLAVCNALRLS